MKVVIQRVSHSTVEINGSIKATIEEGILVLCGFENNDNEEDIIWVCNKIANLRIFNDQNGIMNLCVKDIDGDIMVISQFTLHASTKKGNRPSYIAAAKPEIAKHLYNKFLVILSKNLGKEVKSGEFGSYMRVSLLNDGPVTIIIDSKNKI